ncbi:hypothetical protein [Virgibacillus proomii]|uniref:hypothetical protein n=1 Tax=Virgibacillus proomii TaxID=84407 RepID=UPI001C0FA0F5|nr:hypothetical protein [Virgibacillus proomii]MBU5267019.1 hypothetical protein [Virgibacillus proomii]
MFFFFKDKESYDSNTSHAEKVFFFFKDKESYDSNTSHAEKCFSFSRTRKATTATHRTQKSVFLFQEHGMLRKQYTARRKVLSFKEK